MTIPESRRAVLKSQIGNGLRRLADRLEAGELDHYNHEFMVDLMILRKDENGEITPESILKTFTEGSYCTYSAFVTVKMPEEVLPCSDPQFT